MWKKYVVSYREEETAMGKRYVIGAKMDFFAEVRATCMVIQGN